MASVNSTFRKLVKPIVYKALGQRGYFWFLYRAKIRDIEKRLVEEEEMALLPRFITKNSVCLDLGANYAYYTVRMAELCKAGKVYAFEPVPKTHEVCAKIVKHYRLKNVELFKKGVGEQAASIQFEVPLQKVGTYSAGQAHFKHRNNELEGREVYHNFDEHETVECEVVALDQFLGPLSKLDFVKIDIEGAELFALKGMRSLLARLRPVILVEVVSFFLKGFGISETELRKFIFSLGYEVYRYDSKRGSLELDGLTAFSDRNYVLIHKDRRESFGDLIASEAALEQRT